MDTVFLLAEQRDGVPLPLALELCTAARSFAAHVTAFTWGEGSSQATSELGAHGVTRLCDLGSLGGGLAGARVAAAVEAELGTHACDAVFVGSSCDGRDIAGRLSARIDRPVLANVVGLVRDDAGDGLVSTHNVFGGSVLVRARFTGAGPAIFVIRPKSFVAERGGAAMPELVHGAAVELGGTDAARVVARHLEKRSGPSLDDASVVVAGGRGLGTAERFALVEQLAELLGGAPAASRAIVDAGWVPYAYQVGQTGTTVKPEVYLAFGISGATQHLVGMKNARHIVAVNKDPDAPIFKVADLGIVGDVNQVLPKLVEALRSRG